MTRGDEGIEFRILGSLEAGIGEQPLPLGGAKQRAVLAVLLLHADEVVSIDRLVDEVWGDAPPPSAAHTVEAYVSRLRQLVHGHGPALVRRGRGYALELGGASLDARRFEALADEVDRACESGDHRRVGALAVEAVAVWRGPALSDVALASAGRAAAERLEELRLHVLEQRFDAELALGRHREVTSELQGLVAHNPYRERFVAQLMLALYRCGRHADALEAYEQTRRKLDADLGLQPSAELRELSGRIVRQDPRLQAPVHVSRDSVRRYSAASARTRRVATLVAGGLAVAAVMTLTASGGGASLPASAAVVSERVALVLPRSPETSTGDPRVRYTAKAFQDSVAARGLQGEVLVADESDPTGAQTKQVVSRIEEGGYALAIVAGERVGRALAPVARRSSETTFVFLDMSAGSLSLAGVPNVTGLPFADQESSYLMGYLSGLVPLRGDPPGRRADVVAIVVSRKQPRAERLAEAFRKGARRADPDTAVRVAYVDDETDKTACERLTNDLVDAGSDVVYSVAGQCSPSVLAVVQFRGVWGIRANDDPFAYGPHILATTYKYWDLAVAAALNGHTLGTLPRGRDIVLGLADDYAVTAWASSDVPESQAVWSKVVRVCSGIRARTKDDAP